MKSHAERNLKSVGLALLLGLAVAVTIALPAGVHAAAGKGQEIFKSKCAGCHGPDGKGETSMGKMMHLKNLGSEEVQEQSDEKLHEIITNGKPPMPAFGHQLSKAEIGELVAYIRTLKKKK
jgi:cytochrome c6